MDGRLTKRYVLFAIALSMAVFAFDLMMPLGVAAGVPYVVLVLLGYWAPGRREVIFLAVGGSFLTIAGYLLSEH